MSKHTINLDRVSIGREEGMKESDDERGWMICTAPHCRTLIRYGQGVQFVDGDQKLQRYCEKHYCALCECMAGAVKEAT